MQVWLWIYCAMRAEKSIDTLFILRTDKRFKDWKEHSRCGRQSLSLASLDSSLYTREPDPSVGCADSSPDKGSLCGARWFCYGILRCAQDDSKFRGIAGDRKGRPYGPDKGSQCPPPMRGRLWGMEQSQYTFFLRIERFEKNAFSAKQYQPG